MIVAMNHHIPGHKPRRGGMILDNDFKCAVFCGIAKKPTLVRAEAGG